MMKRTKLALSLAGLLAAPIACTSFAQNAPTEPSQSQPAASASQTQPPASGQANTKQLQTVVVTGSALPRIDAETPSPVTVITAQQIARSGLTTISDVVRAVSADNSGSIPNAFTNGFAAGASGVALRGLTVNSTLVLIDGHRSASYAVSDDGERSFVDLNTIPIAAIDRIEVLKDGASSIYGADAIAGVVNIILKPGYTGVEGTADVGDSQRGGGFTKKATFLAGGGNLDTDRYNAYFSAQYEKDNAIEANQRPFPFNTTNLSSFGGSNPAVPSNGFGSIYGSVTPSTGGNIQPLRSCAGAPFETQVTNDPNSPGSYCEQNSAGQYGQVQAATENEGLYSRFTVKLNDTTKAYLSASYNESKTWTVTSPAQIQSATPNNTDNITLPVGNPSNPFTVPALINYAFGDIPNGVNYDNHNARVVGDVAGTTADWNWDAAVVINHTWLNTTQFGLINYNALVGAINNGTYNFANPSANSAAVLNSLSPGYAKTSTSDLDSLDLSANREVFDLPGGSAGLALGTQFRHEAQNDPTLNPNFEFQGLGIAQTKGSRDVSGIYAELDAPLLESLEADVSGRFDHYTDVGNNFSPKLGLKWKPLDWVAVRGTWSKGFRAPSFAENGSSSAEGFVTYTPPAAFQAEHGNNGYVQPYALAENALANPNIKPEKATNFTFGVVLQPASWLSTSLDYYNIKKTNVITQSETGSALAAYYAGTPQAPGVSVIADLPDPANPNAQARPIEVIGEYVNANSLKTSGIDLDLQGHWDFGNGIQFISELSGTEVFNWQLILPGGVIQQYVGTQGPYNLSSGAGTPRLKGSWANSVLFGGATVTLTMYHTSGYAEIAEDVGVGPGECLTTTPDGEDFPNNCEIGSFTDFDLTGSYNFNEHVSVTGSIMNLFNKLPPFDPANYAGAGTNYNPTWSQAGIVGRFFNVGVKLKM
jgi:iron complex outermembrane recepter protein